MIVYDRGVECNKSLKEEIVMEIEMIFVAHGVVRVKAIYEDGTIKFSGKTSKHVAGEIIKSEVARYLDKQDNFEFRLYDGKNWIDQSMTSEQIRELLAKSAA